MDPIRPIGPIERDIEPVVRIGRSSPDDQRERREPEDPPERRRPPAPALPRSEENDDGGSLIDVRV